MSNTTSNVSSNPLLKEAMARVYSAIASNSQFEIREVRRHSPDHISHVAFLFNRKKYSVIALPFFEKYKYVLRDSVGKASHWTQSDWSPHGYEYMLRWITEQ
jgi:hypothetical protein